MANIRILIIDQNHMKGSACVQCSLSTVELSPDKNEKETNDAFKMTSAD